MINFWTTPPRTAIFSSSQLPDGQKLFNEQMNSIANNILIADTPNIDYLINTGKAKARFQWTMNGEVVAGSHMSSLVNPRISAGDIDIYVHSKEDSNKLIDINGMRVCSPDNEFCCSAILRDFININIIWGIKYSSSLDLISRFDIRACAIAYDPNSDEVVQIKGATEDCFARRIVFQTNPRAVSIQRLLKYINKGFTIDKYQRAVFAELIKTGKHSTALEIATGYKDSP